MATATRSTRFEDQLTEDPAQRENLQDAAFDALSAESINQRHEVTPEDDLLAVVDQLGPRDAVVLSLGVHEIDEPLTIDGAEYDTRPAISFVGQGHRVTRIQATGDFPVLELTAPRENAQRVKHPIFAHLQLTHPMDEGRNAYTANVVEAENQDNYRFINVYFNGKPTTGNGIYAEVCWDWKCFACNFSEGGHPDRGTADIYMTTNDSGNTNSFHIISCRFEKVVGGAIKGVHGGQANPGRFRITNCKFHSSKGSWVGDVIRPRPAQHTIDGQFGVMQIVGCHFQFQEQGHIRQRSGNTLLVTNNSFRQFGGRCIEVGEDVHGVALSDNEFYTSSPAGYPIHVAGEHVSVTGNLINQGGENDPDAVIRSTGTDVSIVGNNLMGAPNDGIRVEGSSTTVTGNTVEGAGAHGINVAGGQLVAVGNNATRECGAYGVRTGAGAATVAVGNNVDADSEQGGFSLEGEAVLDNGNVSGSI